MFRNVVVGYDGPQRGGDALALAEVLCDSRRGKLLLVAAYPAAAVPIEPIGMAELDEARRQQELASLAEARDRFGGEVPIQGLPVPASSPARGLTEVSERESADLVVVGSTHRGRLGRVVPGTTAERLLQGAPCAVAVAPRGYNGAAPRHIAIAYDGSPEAEAALSAAEAIALELEATLTCYCVVEPGGWVDNMLAAGTGAEWPFQVLKRHCRRLLYAVKDRAPEGLELETCLLHGHAAEEIARRARGVVDLLVVGSRGYGPLRRAMVGSVSGALVRDAGCPVIILPRSAAMPRHVSETAETAHA
jgi:nucleotide-binding universal stress UspA family protein